VLPAGAFQVLRRRANMSTGGTSRDVRDIIHPDNERLAIQAAQALKLDIAGIDLITPDIGRSWMEVKSAICEVNAQPQISTEFADDVYVNLLRQRLPVHTRMRTVLLVNFDELATGQTDLEYVEAELIRQGERVLCIKENGTWLAGTKIAPSGDMSISRAAINAELNPSATALLICLSFQTVLADGIPWQKIDHICWIGLKHLASQSENPKLLQLQSLLQGHLVGPICICAQDIGSSPGPVRGLNFEFLPTLSSGWPMSQRATAALHIENENLA
jgi:cyanophycin synthetase